MPPIAKKSGFIYRTAKWLYAAYALASFAILSTSVLVLILPVPWQHVRRAMVRRAARLALTVTGIKVSVLHADRLPTTACIVVANHSSYLDGIVLYAALPPRFGFVIKREMSRVPLANLLLRRIGAHFVDRGQGQKGARDARKLFKTANQGAALAFFPEGTFRHEPGLMPFRHGAFLIAARSKFPVMPIAIRGTRQALPPGTMMPRPGLIEIELAPLQPAPASTAETDVQQSMQAARAAILERINEPDLAQRS